MHRVRRALISVFGPSSFCEAQIADPLLDRATGGRKNAFDCNQN